MTGQTQPAVLADAVALIRGTRREDRKWQPNGIDAKAVMGQITVTNMLEITTTIETETLTTIQALSDGAMQTDQRWVGYLNSRTGECR